MRFNIYNLLVGLLFIIFLIAIFSRSLLFIYSMAMIFGLVSTVSPDFLETQIEEQERVLRRKSALATAKIYLSPYKNI